MLSHSLQNIGHLLTLPFGPGVLADSLLQKLETPLVFGNPEQLHGSTLIGRKASNFSDQVTDHLVPVGEFSFRVRRLLLQGIDGGLVTFVHADAYLVSRSHDAKFKKRVKKTEILTLNAS